MIDRRAQNSEHYLNLLMDASPNLIVITNGTKLYAANKTLLTFIGYPSIEAFSKEHEGLCDFFEPYNDDALLKQMGSLTWIEEAIAHPYTHLAYMRKEGVVHAFKVYVQPIQIEENHFYVAIFNDVTELEMQKELYRQAIEGSQIGLWDWDLTNNTLYFAPRWKEMLGYQDHELPNTLETWQERVHPEDLDSAIQAIQDNVDGRTLFYQNTHRLRHKNGHWVWIDDRGKTFFNKNNQAVRMIGVHHDVSRIKESEAKNHLNALRSEALLKLPLLNESLSEPEFMQSALEIAENLTHSSISFIHFVNDDETSIELVTWSRRTLQDYCHAVYDLHYPASSAGIWADALRQRRTVIINDYPNYAFKKGLPDGHAMLERFVSLPIIEEGKVVMLCGIGNKVLDYDDDDIQTLQLVASETWRLVQRRRNLAKIKHTQELLIAQSRNAAMGEMVSMIAHQWRQPISIIAMCANNMLLDMELESIEPKAFEKQLRDILFQTEHLSSTIDDFRNFFKPNRNKELVSVKSVLDDALKLMRKTFENHTITLNLSYETEDKIPLYTRELMQVFLNILKNATEVLEHNPPTHRKIDIALYQEEHTIVVRLCDNAGGIKEEHLGKIFEPYFSTKDEKNGTGLGLYMSKMIVEKHLQGELKAYNYEEGACFEVILPKQPLDQT